MDFLKTKTGQWPNFGGIISKGFATIALITLVNFQPTIGANSDAGSGPVLKNAISNASAGDTITVTANINFSSNLSFGSSGQAGNPIVVRGKGPDRIVFESTLNHSNGAYTVSGEYIEIQNIYFKAPINPITGTSPIYKNAYPPGSGSANGNLPWGLLSTAYTNVKVGRSSGNQKGIVFKNCQFRGGMYDVISAVDVNLELYNCLIDNMEDRWGVTDQLIDCRRCKDVKIVNSTFKWNMCFNDYLMCNKLGATGDWGKGMVVEGNTFHVPTPKGETWLDNTIQAGPFIGSPQLTNEPNANFVFRYNLFIDVAYTPINVDHAFNIDIYNNTFINCAINPNWEASGEAWPNIGHIRLQDGLPNGAVTIGEGADGRIRNVNIVNNLFWSNHPAVLERKTLWIVDGYAQRSGTPAGSEIPGFNMDGNVVWHTENETNPGTVGAGVNINKDMDWWAEYKMPQKNTSVANPKFKNATGDLTGDYTPTELPAAATFTHVSKWVPEIAGTDPNGNAISGNFVGAINPGSEITGIRPNQITAIKVDHGVSLGVMANPFSGAGGNIYFTLAQPEKVTIALFDLRGRQVLLLEKGAFAKGRWVTPISTRGLSNGHYLVQLKTRTGFSTTQKLSVKK